MIIVWFLLSMLGAYLFGSIPTAYLIGRLKGVDIRTTGSGNSGATNALRVLGRGPAAIVLTVDAAKGVLAVLLVPPLALWLASPVTGGGALGSNLASEPTLQTMARIVSGASCVLGHVFPLWLGFKGGKGVATGAAVVFALAPKAALVCLVVFILVAALGRYVSLASISASLVLPGAYAALYQGGDFSWWLLGFCLAATVLVTTMHRKNITRLLRGTEARLGNHRAPTS